MELYKKYRPKRLKDVIGQDDAVNVIRELFKRQSYPHATLFTGPSGCGKTTIARIIAKMLGCNFKGGDFHEINAAESRGIDTVRAIGDAMGLSPIGKCKVYLLDEAHQLTRKKGGDAQTALLKMLEDTPDHVYFMLATTDSQELLKTIKTRCISVAVNFLDYDSLNKIILYVLEKESIELEKEVIEKIIEGSEGSARQALNILDSIIGLASLEDKLKAIGSLSRKEDSFRIVKALLWEKITWASMCKIIESVDKDEDWEKLRRAILTCASNELLKDKKNKHKAYLILSRFETNFYDSGRAGLIKCCYEVLNDD